MGHSLLLSWFRGGILIINPLGKSKPGNKGFRVPYVNSRWFLLPIWAVVLVIIMNSESLHIAGKFSSGIQEGLWFFVKHNFPALIFVMASVIITMTAVIRKWSLIPVLGLLTNLYLMSELGVTNWMRFLVWLVVGLMLYFTYGFKHSRLRRK